MAAMEPTTMDTTGDIRAMDARSVAKICSGQVVVDLATAAKELVENALDAGATHVEVRLKDSGAELIEVTDNGAGIAPEDYASLALKYHTSKLNDFAGLAAVRSFGFRGEALSSLCEISGALEVVTRRPGDALGARLGFARDGKLASRAPVARAPGTTVSVRRLFAPLPVRANDLRRHLKRHYQRLLRVLQGYAVVALGARVSVVSLGAGGRRQVVLSTQANRRLRDNVSNVFGAKCARRPPSTALALSGVGGRSGRERS